MRSRTGLRVVIPGGSGLLGNLLSRRFHAAGHEVTVLSRNPRTAMPWHSLGWDGSTLGSWTQAFDGADVIINLAGRSVNCRYNAANRRIIKESRTASTRLVGDAIASVPHPPALWINSSTATIYRHALDRPMDEATGELGGNEKDAPDTWRFSIDVAKSWEDTFFNSLTPHTRKIALRTAVVMSPDNGSAFDILSTLVRRGLGGTSGRGDQFVSWIHDDDFARAVDFLIHQPAMDGTVNLSSAHPLPNRDFMRVLREAWGTRVGLPAPAWLLEIGAACMHTETELVLKSRRVIPSRLLDAGFVFTFATWPQAAADLVKRSCARDHVR